MVPSVVVLFTATFLVNLAYAENFTAVLNSTRSLSTLNSLIGRFPGIVENLTGVNGTFFAPSNSALDTFIQAQGSIANLTADSIQNLIQYHLLPTVYDAASLRTEGGSVVETRLTGEMYANLQGPGNVVFASAYGSAGLAPERGDLMIYSGVGEPANVTQADIEFIGGVVHVIDRVLNFPRTCTQTAEAAALSTLIQAFRSAQVWQTVDRTARFTCFAPTDEAFQRAGVDVAALSETQLVDVLHYHAIVGEVGYSTALEDGQDYQTMLGVPVTVHKRDGQLFINDVAVQQSNIIMTNGVAHLLSGVLTIPANATTTSDAGANPTPTSPGDADAAGDESSAVSMYRSKTTVLVGFSIALATMGFTFF